MGNIIKKNNINDIVVAPIGGFKAQIFMAGLLAQVFEIKAFYIFETFIEVRQMCRYLDLYLEFERIKPTVSSEGKKVGKLEGCTIEFKNVSFKYPRSKSYTLRNISIKINNGEKLSVIGLNGAGKTTFIKLLTRLYEPTEGEILLNGFNIKEYDFEEYMKLLSVVF